MEEPVIKGDGGEDMINLIAPISQTGFGTHGRNFAIALNRIKDVCLRPLYGMVLDLRDDEKGIINEMTRRRFDPHRITILLGNTLQMKFKLRGPIRVGYTVFEIDEIPERDIEIYKDLSEVWVTSQWAKGILKGYGIEARVVPEGVNLDIFHPINPKKEGRFRFLSIGKLGERKNFSTLIEAFCEEFSPVEDVELICLWFDQEAVMRSGFKDGIFEAFKFAKAHIKGDHRIGKRIIIQLPLPTKHDLARLYRSVDCGVFPYRAEGWCLPLMEMMACGKPCIATNYSAPTEYINNNNCYLLSPGRLIPAVDPKVDLDGKRGRWADPPKEELKMLMRRVFTHQEEARQLGLHAAKEMKRWSWDNAARIAAGYIDELEERYNLK
jgi:hypothetical protein